MNATKIKSLVQIKHDKTAAENDSLEITMLLTEELLQSLLDQMRSAPEKRAAIIAQMPNFQTEVTIEVYRPGETRSETLRYVQNLKRDGKDGYSTEFVSPL